MFIMKYKKIFISLGIGLTLLAAAVMVLRGFNVGIEFTGGSIIELSYSDRPDIDAIKAGVAELGITGDVQLFGDNQVLVRSRDIAEGGQDALVAAMTIDGQSPTIERADEIGPSIGRELRRRAIASLLVVALAIIVFVAYAFRKVSRPVSSWKYGLAAVLALVHDVAIPAGLFALLGGEVNSLFVVGLLSIVGLSVNDTIVVFDRIRENLRDHDDDIEQPEVFESVVGDSIRQTIARSINTSLTLVVVLVALLALGPDGTKELALVMLFGMIAGTYSSIFFASPLLVAMNKNRLDQSTR